MAKQKKVEEDLSPADDFAAAMTLALTRQLLAKGLLDDNDIAAMLDGMEARAERHDADRPKAARAARRGANAFRRSLSADPGLKLPLVLTGA